jgi:hypothetical protein
MGAKIRNKGLLGSAGLISAASTNAATIISAINVKADVACICLTRRNSATAGGSVFISEAKAKQEKAEKSRQFLTVL